MIEVNLIPDVKQEYLRAQRMRNTVVSGAILVSLIAGGLVVALGAVLGAQGLREAVAASSIKSEHDKLKQKENLNDLVTIQNQLSEISAVNDAKGVNSRVFDMLAAVNPVAPNDVRMSNVTIDPTETAITIEGSAANSFIATDALKKTILNTKIEYVEGEGGVQSVPLTEEVLLTDASYGVDASGARVLQFKLTFSYPEQLLSNTVTNVKVVSPTGSIDVTDSRTRVPDSLFQAPAVEGGED